MFLMRPAQGPLSKITLIHTPRNLNRLVTRTIRTDVQNVRHTHQPRNAKAQPVRAATITQLNALPHPEMDQAGILIPAQRGGFSNFKLTHQNTSIERIDYFWCRKVFSYCPKMLWWNWNLSDYRCSGTKYASNPRMKWKNGLLSQQL